MAQLWWRCTRRVPSRAKSGGASVYQISAADCELRLLEGENVLFRHSNVSLTGLDEIMRVVNALLSKERVRSKLQTDDAVLLELMQHKFSGDTKSVDGPTLVKMFKELSSEYDEAFARVWDVDDLVQKHQMKLGVAPPTPIPASVTIPNLDSPLSTEMLWPPHTVVSPRWLPSAAAAETPALSLRHAALSLRQRFQENDVDHPFLAHVEAAADLSFISEPSLKLSEIDPAVHQLIYYAIPILDPTLKVFLCPRSPESKKLLEETRLRLISDILLTKREDKPLYNLLAVYHWTTHLATLPTVLEMTTLCEAIEAFQEAVHRAVPDLMKRVVNKARACCSNIPPEVRLTVQRFEQQMQAGSQTPTPSPSPSNSAPTASTAPTSLKPSVTSAATSSTAPIASSTSPSPSQASKPLPAASSKAPAASPTPAATASPAEQTPPSPEPPSSPTPQAAPTSSPAAPQQSHTPSEALQHVMGHGVAFSSSSVPYEIHGALGDQATMLACRACKTGKLNLGEFIEHVSGLSHSQKMEESCFRENESLVQSLRVQLAVLWIKQQASAA